MLSCLFSAVVLNTSFWCRIIRLVYHWDFPMYIKILFCSFSFQISIEKFIVCFIFLIFERFLMVCISWLELFLTDARVNFISVTLCYNVILALYKTIFLGQLLFRRQLDLLMQFRILAWVEGFEFVTVLL